MNAQPPPPSAQPVMPPVPRRRIAASRVIGGVAIGCIASFATIGWFAVGATAQIDDNPPAITDEEFEQLFKQDSTINFDHEDGECGLSSIVGDGFDIEDIDWGAITFQFSTSDSSLDAFLDTGNGQFTLACLED